jgi:hypothetical protein
MDDFKIVIDGKEHSCTKCDKVYVELDNSATRSDIDCTEIKQLIESFNIPREPISCTIHIKKKSPNYKRRCKFFKKLLKECKQNEN